MRADARATMSDPYEVTLTLDCGEFSALWIAVDAIEEPLTEHEERAKLALELAWAAYQDFLSI